MPVCETANGTGSMTETGSVGGMLTETGEGAETEAAVH